jgi:hypothetical protein
MARPDWGPANGPGWGGPAKGAGNGSVEARRRQAFEITQLRAEVSQLRTLDRR